MGEYLTKWCVSADHTLSRAKFLRLGSIEEFRCTPDPIRRDAEEGSIRFVAHFDDKVRIPATDFAQLFPGPFVFEGVVPEYLVRPFVMNVDTLKYNLCNPEEIIFDGNGLVDFNCSETSSFVFCMSRMPMATKPPLADAVASWGFDSSFISKFANNLREAFLRPEMYNDLLDFDRIERPIHETVKDLEVVVDVGPIIYENNPETYHINSAKDVIRLIDRIRRCEFYKRTSFQHEREFRFVVRYVNNSQVLPLKKTIAMVEAQIFRDALAQHGQT